MFAYHCSAADIPRDDRQIMIGGGQSLAACFIETTLADVPHPLDYIVVAVVQLGLKHLQIAHLETRRSKRHLYTTHSRIITIQKNLFNGLSSAIIWISRYQQDKPFWI